MQSIVFFHLHFVVIHIYEILHLLALWFIVKLAISLHAVAYYYYKLHPKAERDKKH